MITVINRKELCIRIVWNLRLRSWTFLQNGIDYQIKTVNRKSPSPMAAGSRVHTGTLGEKLGMEYEYIIYVRKEDYDKASGIISSGR
ncbi:MAG: hypothetical protein V8S08_09155 [Lachnoclostridium sp.]